MKHGFPNLSSWLEWLYMLFPDFKMTMLLVTVFFIWPLIYLSSSSVYLLQIYPCQVIVLQW